MRFLSKVAPPLPGGHLLAEVSFKGTFEAPFKVRSKSAVLKVETVRLSALIAMGASSKEGSKPSNVPENFKKF